MHSTSIVVLSVLLLIVALSDGRSSSTGGRGSSGSRRCLFCSRPKTTRCGFFRSSVSSPSESSSPGSSRRGGLVGKVGSTVGKGLGKVLFQQLKKVFGSRSKGAAGAVAAAGGGALFGGAAALEFGGKAYYWPKQHEPWAGEFMCTTDVEALLKVAATDASDSTNVKELISKASLPDGSKPIEIEWPCRKFAEVCCEATCCPTTDFLGTGSLPPN